jgi:acetyl/propionyl-CoA carboxylase alpha subunit
LQVEHPVTELVTGQDLVAWQIAVAEGAALPLRQDEVTLRGHAIEVRIYAEDPSRDYMPSAGRLVRAHLPAPSGGRVDGGYEDGDVVGVHYDAMLAKVIAWGEDRARANRSLRRALRASWLPGVATNLPMLRSLLDDPCWRAGDVDTSFLSVSEVTAAPPSNLVEGALVASVFAWYRLREQAMNEAIPRGWRMSGVASEVDTWAYLDEEVLVTTRDLGEALEVTVGSREPVRCEVVSLNGDVLRLRRGEHVTSARVVSDAADGSIGDGATLYLHLGHGEAMVRLVPRFSPPAGLDAAPGSCVAPTPAVVRALHVAMEQSVTVGDPLVTLEAMKMEHVIRAPFDGTVVAVLVDCDQSVQQGALLIRLEPTEET